jgi:AcrR family transcriptional regulator
MDRLMSDARSVRARLRLEEVDEAARRVIARKGLASATMRDISREGGFTTGVLTHHFPDKQALIAGVFAATSRAWIADARAALQAATTVPELLSAFVAVSVPRDPERREEWRLWAEMWTYAGRDRAFVAELEAADALWEAEIRAMLERVRDEGLLPPAIDLDIQAAVLARLVDGLGLRAWLSGGWEPARNLLIGHLASLGLPMRVVAGLAAEGAGVPA